MELDDELCLCFHVTKRKVQNFLKVEKPARPSQMSECFGAGTGCGWCRPFLVKMWEAAASQGELEPDLPTSADYARANEVRSRRWRHSAARRHANRR